MPLEAQKAVVQFRGLETKIDDKQAVPGDLTLLENVRFDVLQEFTKRNGYRKLGQTAALFGQQLATFKNELLISDGLDLYGYAASGLISKGSWEPLSLSTQSVSKSTYTLQMPDAGYHPLGVSVFAWESIENGVTLSRYTISDNSSKQPLVANALLGVQAWRPKVVVAGDYIYIFYFEATDSSLGYVRLLAMAPTATPTVGLAAVSLGAAGLFDATAWNGAVYLTFATIDASIKGITFTPNQTSPVTLASSVAATVLALAPSTVNGVSEVWALWSTGMNVIAKKFDAAWGNPVGPVTVESFSTELVLNIAAAATTDHIAVFTEVLSPTAGRVIQAATATSSARESGFVFLYRAGLASKVFQALGQSHLVVAFQSTLQSTYFVTNVTRASANPGAPPVVAKFAAGVGGGYTKRPGLPEVSLVSAEKFLYPYLQADRLISTAGGLYTQTGVQAAVLDWNAIRESLELGDTLFLTGGVLGMYDGVGVYEHGFHVYPEDVTVNTSLKTGAGAGSSAGSYQICAVYEWTDNYGNVYQSSPSPVVPVRPDATGESVVFAGQKFSYTVSTYCLGSNKKPVSIAIYRTVANQSVFYRVTSITTPLLNTTASHEVSFSEEIADDVLSANAQLLANPLNSMAEVPALACDAPRFITRYRNRAVVIPAEAPGQWLFSKSVMPAVPIEFNSQQFFNPVQGGGTPLNCAIEMDDKLILFSETGIYWTAGDGPAPNGTGNDYGNAFTVPSDVGCSNPRSLVLTPKGVMFQSAKGMYLLGRDLSVQYIGASAERFNSLRVTSATLVANSRRVVFTMERSAPNVNMALVYDYFVEKWSVWSNYGAVDALAFNGLLTHLLSNGTVHQETPGVFSDDGAPVLIKLRTSWLSFAGLSGFQRVWRFILRGSYHGTHKLKISVAFDDNPAPKQNVEVNATQVLKWKPNYGGDVDLGPVADTSLADTDNPGGGKFANYEWQVKLLQQKCTSVQVTITEAPTGSPNEGLSISVLTFLVGVLPKLRKLGSRHNLTPGTPAANAPRGVVGG
jgi:hypothetical protein